MANADSKLPRENANIQLELEIEYYKGYALTCELMHLSLGNFWFVTVKLPNHFNTSFHDKSFSIARKKAKEWIDSVTSEEVVS